MSSSIIFGHDSSSGVAKSLQLSSAGKLLVDAEATVGEHYDLFANQTVSSGATSNLWFPGDIGEPYKNRLGGKSLKIKSDNAADSSAGTGVRQVYVEGVDGSWAKTSETVTMNGTTFVNLVNTYARINVLKPVATGSDRAAAGSIWIEDQALNSNVFATMKKVLLTEISGAHREGMTFSVPVGYQAKIHGWEIIPTSASLDTRVWLSVHENADETSTPFTSTWDCKWLARSASASTAHLFSVQLTDPIVVPAKSDIMWGVVPYGANAEFTGSANIVLEAV